MEHETSSLYSCWKGNQASRSCFLEAASLLWRVSWICGMIIGGTYRAPETMATTLDMMLEESIARGHGNLPVGQAQGLVYWWVSLARSEGESTGPTELLAVANHLVELLPRLLGLAENELLDLLEPATLVSDASTSSHVVEHTGECGKDPYLSSASITSRKYSINLTRPPFRALRNVSNYPHHRVRRTHCQPPS